MRRLAALLLLTLGACAPAMQSSRPLFTAGGVQPEDGLWALLQPGCAEPQTSAIETWPQCAAPAWIRNGSMVLVFLGPTRGAFVLADGRPRIAQLEAPQDSAERKGESYAYYAVETDAAAPRRRARVWEIACPPEDDDEAPKSCVVTDAAVVRRQAALKQAAPDFVAVWIAP